MRIRISISLFILTAILLISSLVFATPVNIETAKQVANNWYSERNDKAPNDFSIIESFIETENAENIFYIFNFDKTGFVMVSADDITIPILGYVFEHNYTSENHPPQFDAMLASFREQIVYARENNLSASQEAQDEWERLNVRTENFERNRDFNRLGPLLLTTWNQDFSWNTYCPPDAAGPGGYCYAGCTAVATAQVMKFHAHPTTGEGSHSYSCPPYGTLSANFAATTYTWTNMPNTTPTNDTRQLLYHVGVGAEMQYSPTGSGAYIGGVPGASALHALKDYFKYDLNAFWDWKSSYTDPVWHSMLHTELDNSRPLVYAGYNATQTSGHAFVLDGYHSTTLNYYHFNWGWSGAYDGYFYLTNLNPGGSDFTNDQNALFLVEPRKWRPLPDVSIDVSLLPYTGVDLDLYYEGPTTSLNYSVVTDLTVQEFALTINTNNELVFTENPTVTTDVNIDITIRASYTGGTSDDTFNFQITGVTSNIDWGDAPDPTYPTLATSSGAYHQIVQGIQLGSLIDPELDGQPNATATGDDDDGLNDDDGVVFTSTLIPGSNATVTVTASVPGILDAWLDFDIDGLWIQANDQIFMNHSLAAGPNVLNFSVPASAALGITFARFRFNTVGVLGMTGGASNGEVEDYQVTIGEESSIKWEQLPDLTENGMDVTCSNNDMFGPPVVLADDFECTTTGPITDIHVWGSWWQDIQPEDMSSVIFHLSIRLDIPDPDGLGPEYSMPGNVLWNRDFYFGEYDSELYHVGQEGWFDPLLMVYEPLGDTECWLYNFYIDEAEAFIQEGSPDEPVVYWLEVQAEFLDPWAMFGWKTSETHWNDDAVWGNGIAPFDGQWNELIYPPGHEFQGQSIDLAFQITTTPEELEEYDFGDAPEGSSAIAYPSTGVAGSFPTCITVGAAGSYVQHGFGENWAWFGPMVDLETDGDAGLCPNCFPTYDDDECFNDGDAGLIMPSSYTIDATGSVIPCPGGTAGSSLGMVCQTATWGTDIDINVTNTMLVDGYVNVLCDWNQDGQWQNNSATHCSGILTSEHVLVDYIVPAGYTGPLSGLMIPPLTFQIGPNDGYIWSRFSITEVPVGTSDWNGEGIFEDGETEDYLILVEEEEPDELDFGDAPDPSYPTLLVNDGARHILDGVTYLGALIDAEPDGLQSSDALGDDNNNFDDEDGVTFTSILVQGYTTYVTVNASITGSLNAWVDFNSDGDWADANEQIFTDTALAAGDNYLSFSVPASSVTGTTFTRFRLNTTGGLSYTGQAIDGEVEDYQVVIHEPIQDSKMHYPQWPDPTGWDIKFDYPNVIADDWQCTESGLVTDLHFWVSYQGDNEPVPFPGIDSLHISIHDDQEVWPGYYTPGDQLWQDNLYPGDFTISGPYYGDQGWFVWDPFSFIQNDHTKFYRIDINSFSDQFVQCQDSIYWLDITIALQTDYQIGWKTSGVEQFRMDAVYGWYCGGGSLYEWEHMIDPITEESLDMAFVITGEPGELDFGDAPDPPGAMKYPTLLANNGARHVIDYVTFLGDSIDAEPDGLQSSDALGDDNNNVDDEDGVTFNSSLIPGGSTDVTVIASVDGVLNAWVDFDCNNDWGDLGEQIFTNTSLVAGTNTLSFSVPAGAVNDTTFARFRFNLTGNLDYEGLACRGEVEDYLVVIEESLDFGDAPDPTYPTLLASNGARHALDQVTYLGSQIDAEADGWQSINALGDDNHDLDDEDGVIFTCPLIPGEQGAITVITNSAGVAFFNSWIDFNADGDWSDAGEHFLIDQSLLSGIHPFYFDVPIGATIDSTYARFRLCTVAGLADTGYAPDGEVEDYKIEISEIPDDDCKMHFHQWPDTTWYGMDVRATEPLILADDFLCVEDGLINSIHIWGSWLNDIVVPPTFYLSIWSDNPSGSGGYSQPDIELWGRFFGIGDYTEFPYMATRDGEWWYDPWSPLVLPAADYMIWQYDFAIPDSEAFVQEDGTIYWLSMTVFGVPPDPDIGFGWKTSVNHWNDDAVWGLDGLYWNELRYPDGHPYHPLSIDFAFYINCEPTTPIVNISVSSDTVYVTWDPIPCANTYTVYSSTDPYATFPTAWTLEQAGITTTSWCENVSGTTKKFYKVVAIK